MGTNESCDLESLGPRGVEGFFFEQMLKIQNKISAHLHRMGSKVLPGSEEITLNTSEEPSMENQRSSSREVTAEAMPRLLFRTSLPSAWRGTCIKVPHPWEQVRD